MPEVARSRLGVITYLVPPRSLDDAASIEALALVIDSCVAEREINLVVDLGNVHLLSSAAIERLLDGHEWLARLGGGLRLANASAVVVDALRITQALSRLNLMDPPPEDEWHGPTLVPQGRLGDVLVSTGLVSAADVERAMEVQKANGGRIGSVLVDMQVVTETDLLRVLGRQFGIPFVALRTGVFDPHVACLVPAQICHRLEVLPVHQVHGVTYVATADPQGLPSLDSIADRLQTRVKPVLTCLDNINAALREAHGENHDLDELIGRLDGSGDLELVDEGRIEDYTLIDEMAAGGPVVNLVNGLIQRAVRDGASDIHIEPARGRCRVRFRIDGVLYPVMQPPMEVHPALVSRLKVMANLDIAERRLPQDGRVQVITQGRTIDLRFSSLPGIFGEKVVLRVLDKDRSLAELDQLGMSEHNRECFRGLLGRSNGLLLVTGPTGSGKTTTLYAGLSYLNTVEKSIVTIEDPVEYQVDLINQNQVKSSIGLTFPTILKHVLRQDPDIVMVGEIRERETAEIAVQAALTGHLVLSTLHTNDSAGAITRLLDMGIEPFLLSSALAAVLAQRLIRTVCPDCKTVSVAEAGSLARFDVHEEVRLVHGRGCEACYDSGYKGRTPIHELLVCDSSTQRLMLEGPTQDQLAGHLRQRGIKTLRDAGVAKALAGLTTLEEVTRVVGA